VQLQTHQVSHHPLGCFCFWLELAHAASLVLLQRQIPAVADGIFLKDLQA
jgi:hypothetical protein